jgi:Holliday junction resolvase RusA-like endonuclease
VKRNEKNGQRMIFIPALPTSANNMKIWSPKQRRFFTNPKYENAKNIIRQQIILASLVCEQAKCYQTPVSLSVIFNLRNVNKRWDIDNHLKAIKDVLTGIAYEDDSLVKHSGEVRVDRIPKGAIEGFWFGVSSYTILDAEEPHFKDYAPTVKPPGRKESKKMSAEEFNHLYRIHKPKTF